MKKHTVITIGRQFGSGGHEVGLKLSSRLGIPVYDRSLIQMAAGELGVSREKAEEADETVLGRFFSGHKAEELSYTELPPDEEQAVPLSDQMYQIQSEIIRRVAKREPCIIIGRCADCILEDVVPCLNVFVYAEIRDRIERIRKLYNLNEEEAWEKIRRVDRARKEYYEVHTGNTWGGIESHQMIFNISLMDMQDVIDVLAAMYRARR